MLRWRVLFEDCACCGFGGSVRRSGVSDKEYAWDGTMRLGRRHGSMFLWVFIGRLESYKVI